MIVSPVGLGTKNACAGDGQKKYIRPTGDPISKHINGLGRVSLQGSKPRTITLSKTASNLFDWTKISCSTLFV
jgi:hypothetical protein